jgi:hypothetical protein
VNSQNLSGLDAEPLGVGACGYSTLPGEDELRTTVMKCKGLALLRWRSQKLFRNFPRHYVPSEKRKTNQGKDVKNDLTDHVDL